MISDDHSDCISQMSDPGCRNSTVPAAVRHAFKHLQPVFCRADESTRAEKSFYANAFCNIFKLFGIAVRGSSLPSNSKEI